MVKNIQTELIALAVCADVVICGNGIGTASHDTVRAVAPHCKKAVFDADALRLPLPGACDETIYTPHAGEFARITGVRLPEDAADACGRAREAQKAAATLGGTILLKGPVDVISDGRRTRFNRTGDPAMSVGGTGDILPGVCGALLCHLPAFEAGCIAAYVTGKAGEQVSRAPGRRDARFRSHGLHPGSIIQEKTVMVEFTHIVDGKAQMVDISAKSDVVREAVATGRIYLRPATLAAIREGTVVKGNVLATARVAATLAVKETPRIIPMCHTILLGAITVDFNACDMYIEATVTTKSTGKTGVEMEALTGVSVALLTIWDMVKSTEKDENGQYPRTGSTIFM